MFDRRRRPRKWHIVLAAMATLMVASVGVAQFSDSASTAPLAAEPGTVIVSELSLDVEKNKGRSELVFWALAETHQGPAVGATVSVMVTMPNGHSQTVDANTENDGSISVRGAAPGHGKFKVAVMNVQHEGFEFDPENSVTTAEIDVSEDGSEPDPTAPPAETETPEPTETTPPTEDPDPSPTHEVPVGSSNLWHPPGSHDGLPAHEHGDAPPEWANEFSMQNFGHPVIFGGDEATPNENEIKHHAYKGYSMSLQGVDIYFRNHAQANPHGRMARYHSYEIYARDAAGNVSFWQGWQDFGVSGSEPFLTFANCGERTSGGPIMSALSITCDGFQYENWYSRPGGAAFWSWDTGLNIKPSYYVEGDPHDMSTWHRVDESIFGLDRRVEIAWYGVDDALTDHWFCAELTGQILGAAEGNSPNGCAEGIPQYISSTMTPVTFPGNSYRKVFPGQGIVQQPN